MSEDKEKPNSIPSSEAAPISSKEDSIFLLNVYTQSGGKEDKKTYRLHKNRIVIGSAHSADVQIQQNAISNVHAVIELDAEKNATIYDMASETGIMVNDIQVLSHQLKNDDEIKIGFALVTFSVEKHKEEINKKVPLAPEMYRSGHQRLYYNEEEDFTPLILEDEQNLIEIFDYPDPSVKGLQVCLYWGETIIDIQHHTNSEEVSIGSAQDVDFIVPQVQDHFPLVTNENGNYVLKLTENMEGVIRSENGIESIADIKEKLQHSPSGLSKSLQENDIVKIQLGDITIFISFSPAPPILLKRRVIERDPLFAKIWFASMAFTLATILGVSQVEKQDPLEVDELPPRVTKIIFKPARPVPLPKTLQKTLPTDVKKLNAKATKPKPKKKPVKSRPTEKKPTKPAQAKKPKTKPKQRTQKVAQKGKQGPKFKGGQGEGARAKGKEGSSGSKNAAKNNVSQSKAKSRKARKGVGAGAAASKGSGNNRGFIDTLSSDLKGAISKTLSGGSKGIRSASGKLKAYGGFTTKGSGGLGEVGEGKGGGGKSLDVSGLGTKGLGGGKTGKGLGRYGKGKGLIGGRGRPVIEVGDASETVILGGLDKDVIFQVVKSHYDAIRYCYEREQSAGNPNLRGRVMMRFVISGSGRVSKAAVASSSLGSKNVEACVTRTFKRMVFPEPLGGGIVEVSFPFQFAPPANQKL